MKKQMKPLFAHQKESLKFMKPRARVFDMSDPGTAKTRVALEDFARNRRKGRAMLVLAPRSILRNSWGNDAAQYTPDLKVSIAYADNRAEAFLEKADIYVTNHDAIKWIEKNVRDFSRFDRIVIDESTAFKHHTSARSRALNKVKIGFDVRRAMTGTPNTRSITDVWNQAYFLDDGRRLGSNFYGFRSKVAVPEQVGREAQMVKWLDKPGAEEAVADLLSDITIRHKFEDCVDIPPTFKYTKEYLLPKKQLRAYEEMAEDSIAVLKKGYVTAVNKAAMRTKLLQIASGAVYESPERYHVIDDGRYELTLDLVEERSHSIVFYLWKHQRDEIIRQAKERKISFCVFDGETTDRMREEYERLFQAGFYQMMLCHPKSTAHGLTLTKATTTIWPSPPDDLEWWIQGNRRHARTGQTQKTEIIGICAPDTIEVGVYRNLETKQGRMDNLLELLEGK